MMSPIFVEDDIFSGVFKSLFANASILVSNPTFICGNEFVSPGPSKAHPSILGAAATISFNPFPDLCSSTNLTHAAFTP